ncbi:MAG: flagellin [Synergistaceae bacterium]|nr:flagellin [Synergistaceae bacterium]
MRIYHNIPALTAYNSLNATNNAMEKTIQKLSTGLRINSAADDAAGFAISEKMRAQISGLEVAVRNTQDATSMLQVAEGALGETNSMLQRMRELAVQASNDTLTSQDRSYIQQEIDQLQDQIDRIAKTTQFNKKRLLDGSSAGITSSSNQSVKVYVRGSLREIDQFGQKKSFEGNYKITVNVDPSQTGSGQVQKSAVMTIKHPNVITDKVVDNGIKDVTVDNLPAGDYSIKVGGGGASSAADSITQTGTTSSDGSALTVTLGDNSALTDNATVVFTVAASGTNAMTGAPFIQLSYTVDGVAGTNPATIDISGGATVDIGTELGLSGTDGDIKISFDSTKMTALNTGATFTYNIVSKTATEAAAAAAAAAGAIDPSIGAGSRLTGFYNSGAADDADALSVITFDGDDSQTANASVLFEVTSIDTTNGTATLRATSNVLGTDGNVANYLEDAIIVGTNERSIGTKLGLGKDEACKLSLDKDKITNLEVGTKFTYNYTAAGAAGISISGTQDENWPSKWGADGDNVTCKDDGSYTGGNSVQFGLDTTQDLNSKDIHFRNFYINGDNGEVYEGDIVLTTEDDFTTKIASPETEKLASFTAAYIGKTATLDTKLRDLNIFWNSSGVFMLESPKTIHINQGDGKSTEVTLYGTDTIRELQAKFNYAIGTELGQAAYVDGSGASKFCTFVEKGSEDSQGLETVPGTFIFRSVLPGIGGDLTFSCDDEDLVNTFALNQVKGSSTTAFRASIYDAHTGIAIQGATNVKVSDNKLVGVLHPNVDIEFDPTANIKAVWSDAEKNFILTPDDTTYEAIIHLVDSSTVFQIGANEGEDIAIDIGNMSSASIGVTNINVTTREAASKSIGLIDAAINKVSSQRAKIGAYQNALDYTSENLTTTMTNLTAAESRIRDADMAQTMMEFVKLQILNQSGTSMLAQANQLPQSVLSLLQG